MVLCIFFITNTSLLSFHQIKVKLLHKQLSDKNKILKKVRSLQFYKVTYLYKLLLNTIYSLEIVRLVVRSFVIGAPSCSDTTRTDTLFAL